MYREAIGLSGLTVGGVSADELDLVPGDLYLVDASLASAEAFESGDTSTLCTIRWGNTDNEEVDIAYPEGMTVLDQLSPEFPIERRSCFTRPDGGGDYALTACADPHSGQYLAYLDGLPAMGADYLLTLDSASKLFADYGPLDEFCAGLLEEMYPGILDADDWGVWSDALDYLEGWADYDGTLDETLTYPIYCGIYGGDGGSITGDAVTLTAS